MKAQPLRKWVIGLSGVMLSGKSTALAFFKQNGATVVSADEIVGELYAQPAVKAQLAALFGTADKTILASLVFKDKNKRQDLEKFLHPLVLKQMRRQIKTAQTPLVVCEIPLLFEAGWEKWVDMTLVVSADKKTLPARLKGRRLSAAQYKRRLKHQLPEEEKCHRADMVLCHASKTDLGLKIKRLCQAFDLLSK